MTAAVFAFFCLVSFVWIRWRVPETRGKTLEQIETSWKLDGGRGPSVLSEQS